MCGRYSISVSKPEMIEYLEENYNIKVLDEKIELPRYNIAPSQGALSIISDGMKFRVGLLKWGFVPEFAKDDKKSIINARAETIDKLYSFKKSFFERRCLILADGFYEWERSTSTKTPYRFALRNKKVFAFAGLWSVFINQEGRKTYTCTIITTKANELINSIHDRMPVILDEDKAKLWLDPSIMDSKALKEILVPYNSDEMELYQVTKKVNDAKFDDEECIKPLKKSTE